MGRRKVTPEKMTAARRKRLLLCPSRESIEHTCDRLLPLLEADVATDESDRTLVHISVRRRG